jgi:hypothetical protein
MNQLISSQDLDTLIAHHGKPAVSIYLPTTRIPTRVQAESLQFRSLLRDAEEQLGQFDLRGPTISAILEPARQLTTDSDFWRHQKDGMAVFLSEDTFLRYQLPITVDTQVTVAESYQIKPLMPILTSDFVFYILAVSQNQVRLLHCSRFHVQEVDPNTIPTSLQEILSENEVGRQLQFRTLSHVQNAGRQAAVFWSQGAGATVNDKVKIREFFDRIDRGLREYFQDPTIPLIFAGVEYLFPIYKEANTYPNLLESNIIGNPDELHAEELHREAWKLITPIFTAKQTADIELYHNSAPHGLASTDLEELVPWADKGRVQSVFIDKEAIVWGSYNPEQFTVNVQKPQDEHSPHNRDLTDLLALYTLSRGGTVYLMTPEQMEMEFGSDNRHRSNNGTSQNATPNPVAAAIYRFAV